MYKVITHTIREEHFTHPITANVALKGKTQAVVDPFTTPSAIQYRDAAKSAGYKWVNSLRSYVSSTDPGETDLLKEDIKKQSEAFTSTLFGSYMQPMLFNNVNSAFQEYCQAITNSITAIKNKQDVIGARERAQTAAQDLSKVLSRLIRFWPQTALEKLFGSVATEFANQTEYRFAKQYDADIKSMAEVEKLMFSGLPDGEQPLIDLLTKGMILLYTTRFK